MLGLASLFLQVFFYLSFTTILWTFSDRIVKMSSNTSTVPAGGGLGAVLEDVGLLFYLGQARSQ
jgi:hypothetical protein